MWWRRTMRLLAILLLSVDVQGDEVARAREAPRAGHYPQAIAALERVLEREPANLDARVEYARVLSWAGRYKESLHAYDLALEVDPGNQEARLGRARVLYWMGRLDAAAKALQGIEGTEARLVLAQVERARGHNDRALAALSTLGPDGIRLRESILRELRPVLRLGFGVEDDRELPEAGLASTVRSARSVGSLEFNIHPDVRLKLSGMLTQSSTSGFGGAIYGSRATTVASMAEIKFRPAHWLEMNLGGGWGSTGGAAAADATRHQQFLYSIHPVVRWRGLRLDLAFTRSLGDYTPLAIHNSVVEQRQTITASYAWKRWRFGGEYWHAGYSLQSPNTGTPWQTDANGGALFATRVLMRGERLRVEAGARYEAYVFDTSAAAIPNPGFFTPRSYQMYGGTGCFWWRPHKRLEAEVNGLLGRKRFFLFDNSGAHGFDMTGALEARLTLDLGRVRPFLSYAYTSAPSAATVGTPEQYKVHVFGAGVSVRF
jgi:tetratricopeptide (TPR) repeat protein